MFGIASHLPDPPPPELPVINWIKNDPKEHQLFTDGSVFLVALRVGKNGGPYNWEMDVVAVDCDGEGMNLKSRDCGCFYDGWIWSDIEYFALIEGYLPSKENRPNATIGEK